MRFRLISSSDQLEIEITKDLMVVGRKEDCDIIIDHKSISKMHCILSKTDGLLMLRDLGSTNGTRVNGLRVRRAALLPNDQLSIASMAFKVVIDNGPAARVSSSEYTQQLDVDEIENLSKKASHPGELGSSPSVELPAVQKNSLPDVYPDNIVVGKN